MSVPADASPAARTVAATTPASQQVLSPTPYMGWNTYYALGGDPTEAEIKSVADFLVSSGLRDSGYQYVWIDGNWAAPTPRSAAGDLVPNPDQFPNGLKPLVDYIHSKGLKAGIYTDAGPYIPGKCGLGSHGYYQRDADQFAAWKFDAVKADYLCGIAADLDPKTVYTEFAQALRNNASKRPMIFNLCNPVTSPDWGNYPRSSSRRTPGPMRRRSRSPGGRTRMWVSSARSSTRTCCATTTRTRGTPRPPGRDTSTTRTTSVLNWG